MYKLIKNIMYNNTINKKKLITSHKTNKNKRQKNISNSNQNSLKQGIKEKPEDILARMNKINERRKIIPTHLSFVPKDIANLIAGYDYYFEGVSYAFGGQISCEVILPDGNVIGRDICVGILKILNTKTGEFSTTLKCHTSAIYSVAMHPDGRIVSSSMDKTIKIWDPLFKKCDAVLYNNQAISSVAVLSNGYIVAGSYRSLTIWDQTGKKIHTLDRLPNHSEWIKCIVDLSAPACRQWVNCFASIPYHYDSTINIWNLDDKSNIVSCLILKGHTKEVTCIAGLPDGRICSGSEDGTIKIWNIQTGTDDITFVDHYMVQCVTVLPDGRIASGSKDGTIKIWNQKTRKCDVTFYNDGEIYKIKTHPDGRIISESPFLRLKIWS